MGEDRVTFAEKAGDVLSSRQRHSSVISSCSEDAETESTSTGYPPTPDEEREEELEYGPGIVNKLKTRFLSITLKQNRGIRRSCSMENLLDQDRPSRCTMFSQNRIMENGQDAEEHKNQIWGNLKRAKSMDTLLMDLQSEPPPTSNQPEVNGDTEKKPKIVRRRDGGLLRSIPIISDEELPKPDTVKTYKRMFEPAESRRGSYSRRPPVLRASAKSGTLAVSKSNGVSSSAKVNGTVSKSKLCAKQSSLNKAQSDPESMSNSNGSISPPLINGEDSKPVCNGNYLKAIPIKITDNSLCNGKIEKTVEKKMNILNHNMNKKDVHLQNGVLCNGNSPHKELAKIETIEEYIKPDVKKLVNQTNKIVNGSESPITNVVNGVKTKPKVPPNRPTFIKNVRAGSKAELNGIEKKNNLIQKQKPIPSVTSKKISDMAKQEINHKIEESTRSELRLNGDVKRDAKETNTIDKRQTVEENNHKNVEKIPSETAKVAQSNDADFVSKKEPVENHCQVNGDIDKAPSLDTEQISTSTKSSAVDPKLESKPIKKQQQTSESITTSMVFDFRGKDVVPHVAVLPVPFGCKAMHPKKRSLLIDGKEVPNGNGVASDDEDEYHMDYSVPPPSGVMFEGENVKIGKGSILSTRNKDLKIKFDDNVDENTFVYPSETSLLEDGELQSLSPSPPPPSPEVHPPSPSRLKTNPAMGSSGAGGLSTYTPSVLRTVDNFEPGMFRPPPPTPPPAKEDNSVQSGEEENTEVTHEDEEMLKPADPGIISSWSLSAGTSDLLF